jgi:O-antigen ligase
MQYLLPLTFLFTPLYAIKINILGLPANFFMLWVFFVWVVFGIFLLSKNHLNNFFASIKNCEVKIFYFISLFFLGSLISLFVSGINQKTLGEFLVLFVQPISLYFIGKYLFQEFPKSRDLLLATCYFLLSLFGLYAIVQYFTDLGLPLLFQGNDFEPRRAVSFFAHSNFYALWSAPILAFLIGDLWESIKNKVFSIKYLKISAWLLGCFGLLLSLSRAGWLGLLMAALVFVFLAADKKAKQAFFYAGLLFAIIVLFIPSTRHRLTSPLRGEKSASSRLTLWQSGITAVKQSPVFGLGLGGYSENYRLLITDQTLPDHNFPHNIFLNFWVETGILGLVGLIGIISLLIYRGLSDRKNILKLSVALFLIALLTQGQLDNPYLKNDLAAVFWIVLALV